MNNRVSYFRRHTQRRDATTISKRTHRRLNVRVNARRRRFSYRDRDLHLTNRYNVMTIIIFLLLLSRSSGNRHTGRRAQHPLTINDHAVLSMVKIYLYDVFPHNHRQLSRTYRLSFYHITVVPHTNSHIHTLLVSYRPSCRPILTCSLLPIPADPKSQDKSAHL